MELAPERNASAVQRRFSPRAHALIFPQLLHKRNKLCEAAGSLDGEFFRYALGRKRTTAGGHPPSSTPFRSKDEAFSAFRSQAGWATIP